LAFEIFVDRLAKGIAEMTVSLGGLDALVFTGGIGEHSPAVRKATSAKLAFLGVELEPGSNESMTGDRTISSVRSRVSILVIEAQEDWAIAKACARLVNARKSAS
jgi:acetate kinase